MLRHRCSTTKKTLIEKQVQSSLLLVLYYENEPILIFKPKAPSPVAAVLTIVLLSAETVTIIQHGLTKRSLNTGLGPKHDPDLNS